MDTSRILLRAIPILIGVTCLAGYHANAQTKEQVRRAFIDLHDDRVKWNCSKATEWLMQNRERLKGEMVAELYRTDSQGEYSILEVLFRTDSFVPDDRFASLVWARVSQSNRKTTDGSPMTNSPWGAWQHINAFFPLYEKRVLAGIQPQSSVWLLWSTAWVLKSRGILEQNRSRYTPEVLARAATELRNDKFGYNASHVARLFLILGDQSLPALRGTARSDDAQANNLSRALIDAISRGDRRAFGYLNAHLGLTTPPYGEPVDDPEWLDAPTEYYRDRDRYP